MIMKLVSFLILFLFVSVFSFSQEYDLIPVPFIQSDPTIPHPAYNGEPILLKAVARSNNPSDQYYYRWDGNGDGIWDPLIGKTSVADGNWYQASGNELDGWFRYPDLPEGSPDKKLYNATIQVCTSLSGSDPVNAKYGTYRVLYYSGFPTMANINQATDDQLEIMRSVGQEDALWWLHKRMSRIGAGTVNISGYIDGPDIYGRIGNTALYALALLNSNRKPAYPEGTYQEYNNQPQENFLNYNDYIYNTDPYSEDLLRALNFLLTYVKEMSVDNASEADDGNAPVSGTNDLKGYYLYADGNSEFNWHPLAFAALASSHLMGTEIQLTTNNLIKGKPWSFLIQQMVDYALYLQKKSGDDTGGWYYNEGGSSTISYLTSGWTYALDIAEKEFGSTGVYVNNTCKTNLVNSLKRYQNTDGGALYAYGNSVGSLFEATTMILGSCKWLGWDSYSSGDDEPIGPAGYQITKGDAKAIYDKYFNFLTANWTKSGGSNLIDPNRALWNDGDYNPTLSTKNLWNYSLFFLSAAVHEGASSNIDMFGGHDWKREFNISILKSQYVNATSIGERIYEAGNSLVTKYDPYGGTTLASNTLTYTQNVKKLLALPEANTTEVVEGCVGDTYGKVTFVHNKSICFDSERKVIDYQWIFKLEGDPASAFDSYDWAGIPEDEISYDGKAFHTSNSDISIVYTYLSAGNYTAALRVVNDDLIPATDIDSIQITVLKSDNLPPVADANGAYILYQGDSLFLDGTVNDANESCGDVITAAWDIDNDGEFDDYLSVDGYVSWKKIDSLNLALETPHKITIRATDKGGLTAIDTTILTITVPVEITEMSDDKDACVNDSVIISVSATGSDTLKYKWYHDSELLQDKTDSVLKLTEVQNVNAGEYKCIAFNYLTSDTAYVNIYVTPLPDVDLGKDTTITSGNSIELFADVSDGTPDYTFSWTGLSGNSQTETVSPANTTTYSVIVTDSKSCTDSDTITINVDIETSIQRNSFNGISIHPNPATDYLTLDIDDNMIETMHASSQHASSQQSQLSYQLFDTKGQMISAEKITTAQTKIVTSNLAKGIYLLRVINDNEVLKTFKIIKR